MKDRIVLLAWYVIKSFIQRVHTRILLGYRIRHELYSFNSTLENHVWSTIMQIRGEIKAASSGLINAFPGVAETALIITSAYFTSCLSLGTNHYDAATHGTEHCLTAIPE